MIYPLLYDWQKKIVDSIFDKKSFGLFLDCGIGKTPQSLALAEQHGCERVFVITINAKACETTDTSGSWHKWGCSYADGKYCVWSKNSKDFSYPNGIFITNYESLFDRKKNSLKDHILSFLKGCQGKRVALIIDESHRLKDMSTQIYKSVSMVKNLLDRISAVCYMYLLTGTPFTTGFIDVFAQLKFLGCPMNKTTFKDRFCELGHIKGLLGWQQPIVGYKNVDELYELVHKYAITIKSEDVVKLPPQIFVDYKIPQDRLFTLFTKKYLTQSNLDLYNEIRRKRGLSQGAPRDLQRYHKSYVNPWHKNIDWPELDYFCDTPALAWMRARQLSIGFQGNSEKCVWFDKTRLNKIEEFLRDHENNYVLFYNFVPEFIELFNICDKLGYNIDAYNGDIKSLTFYDKYESQSEAQRLSNKKNVILANFASGSTGKNWQLYDKCILFSLPLYKDWEQSIKRVHRVDSKNPVTYHVFYGDNWLDIGMKESLEQGVQYSQDMFNKNLNVASIQA